MSQASNTDLEKNATEHYEGRPLTHSVTPGGFVVEAHFSFLFLMLRVAFFGSVRNPADYSQPALPQYHRKVSASLTRRPSPVLNFASSVAGRQPCPAGTRLLRSGVLAGVRSHALRCATALFPALFTRILAQPTLTEAFVAARGVEIPNVVVPVLALFGGVMQSIVGLVEMVSRPLELASSPSSSLNREFTSSSWATRGERRCSVRLARLT